MRRSRPPWGAHRCRLDRSGVVGPRGAPGRPPGHRALHGRDGRGALGGISAPTRGWGSGVVLTALIGGLAVLALFFLRQATAQEPVLDLRLMFSRQFLWAGGTMAFLMFSLLGGAFVVTQQLQLVLDFSPMSAGLATVPLAAAIVVSSPLSPLVARAIGARITIALGLATMAAGLAVPAFFAPGAGYPPVAVGLVLLGAGMGLAVAPVNDALMSAGPPGEFGTAVRHERHGAGARFGGRHRRHRQRAGAGVRQRAARYVPGGDAPLPR
ncbi:MFS transporter [Streptomyces sp. NPDC048595]|uniref:MFS transporter n=1 Tax=Streptomyces sp. NPDC048595 TaxID=3365576 RepID=UPI00371791CE